MLPMLTLRAALLLVAHASALRIPPPSVISRRDAVTLPALALLAPASPAAAVVEGGAQWELDLPASFAISRRLASIVRSRVSEMLMAEDPTSGVQARLLLERLQLVVWSPLLMMCRSISILHPCSRPAAYSL